ncbi:hypothetical protein C7459_11291 [Tumebacillus permanentifrigoris]|uniref:Uncharacterized protein n=1 Tax=Tumebacillus permanentifrigoris TaxID=378543 RepID=A0A316D6B9_9BACL|nr:hypothetical protein C7459_11291 [Tumebacillus permanentifrigoris]
MRHQTIEQPPTTDTAANFEQQNFFKFHVLYDTTPTTHMKKGANPFGSLLLIIGSYCLLSTMRTALPSLRAIV